MVQVDPRRRCASHGGVDDRGHLRRWRQDGAPHTGCVVGVRCQLPCQLGGGADELHVGPGGLSGVPDDRHSDLGYTARFRERSGLGESEPSSGSVGVERAAVMQETGILVLVEEPDLHRDLRTGLIGCGSC